MEKDVLGYQELLTSSLYVVEVGQLFEALLVLVPQNQSTSSKQGNIFPFIIYNNNNNNNNNKKDFKHF
jgi:hypothetical protein